jgi:DNA-binding winged helix-turn-helix (wHTH) protein
MIHFHWRGASFWVDTDACLLWQDKTRIDLPRRQYELLLYLVRHPGRIASWAELRKAVWQDVNVNDDAISRTVYSLRQALGSRRPSCIETKRGYGLRFVAQLEPSHAAQRSERDYAQTEPPARQAPDATPANETPAHTPRLGKHSYDWSSEVGELAYDSMRVGLRILYEEHALLPELDEPVYRRNRQVRIPPRPFATSPRGFVKLVADDFEWIDPRDRNRRICDGRILRVLPDGRVQMEKNGRPLIVGDVVDVLDPGTDD